METYMRPKELQNNPHYEAQRKKTLSNLHKGMIDEPMIGLIESFNILPCCFTLQCCYGHFIHDGQKDPHNLEPLPITETIGRVEYRIAYICLCIENNDSGRGLLEILNDVTTIDPENIQFCCADWFWKRQLNSYALQVEPERFKHKDSAILDYREALHIEITRNKLFAHLEELVQSVKIKSS